MCNKAKQQNLDGEGDEIQKEYFSNSEQVHQRIRKLSRKLHVHNTIKGLKDENGKTLTEKDEIANKRQDYRKNLYSDPGRTCLPV